MAVDRVRPFAIRTSQPSWKAGLPASSLYFVTDYCDGGNLRQWVEQRRGWRSFAEVGPLLVQCLDALQYAHAHDVIHRGIHPQNVLLTPSPARGRGEQVAVTPGPSCELRGEAVAKLADFALTHNLEVAGLAGMMATGEFHVDYHFLPREQVTDFRACSAASDLWSLAATFYHA